MKTLTDTDIFKNPSFPEPTSYEKRVTVKVVVVNDDRQLAFVSVSAHEYLLLAGGGADDADLEKEAERECLEELSWRVRVEDEIAIMKEFRRRNAKEYETHCFFARAIDPTHEDRRTDSEKKNGLSVVWVDRDDVISMLEKQESQVKKGEVDFYNTAFNIIRDGMFVREWMSRPSSFREV